MIIDSIKHISGMVSSVREVLPGRSYFIPQTQNKQNPLAADEASFCQAILSSSQPVHKALYQTYTGLSPVFAQELCFRAGLDGDFPTASLSEAEAGKLYAVFHHAVEDIRTGAFSPNIVYEHGSPVEFSALPLTMYQSGEREDCASVSTMLEQYYAKKNAVTRIRQKSADLRRIVQTALERNVKKYDLQLRQIKDTQRRDKFRVYGELLNTYGYQAAPGDKSLTARNYYTDEDITIPLDSTITPLENAKKYFEKYNKMKRTYEALSTLTLEVKEEIEHLESISAALDIAVGEEDLVQIREELIENGYIRRKSNDKKVKITSRPFHYISSDGYHIYVGKNNFQNDDLTFRFASGNDWWFHAKGIPGSHVIVKTGGDILPDRTFEEAAKLAAYYSKARGQDKAEIDYTEKKNVKKNKRRQTRLRHIPYQLFYGDRFRYQRTFSSKGLISIGRISQLPVPHIVIYKNTQKWRKICTVKQPRQRIYPSNAYPDRKSFPFTPSIPSGIFRKTKGSPSLPLSGWPKKEFIKATAFFSRKMLTV